jgi:hypothetical protein
MRGLVFTCLAQITRDVCSIGGESAAVHRGALTFLPASRDAWKNRVLASLLALVRMEQNAGGGGGGGGGGRNKRARNVAHERKIIRHASSLRAPRRRDHQRRPRFKTCARVVVMFFAGSSSQVIAHRARAPSPRGVHARNGGNRYACTFPAIWFGSARWIRKYSGFAELLLACARGFFPWLESTVAG